MSRRLRSGCPAASTPPNAEPGRPGPPFPHHIPVDLRTDSDLPVFCRGWPCGGGLARARPRTLSSAPKWNFASFPPRHAIPLRQTRRQKGRSTPPLAPLGPLAPASSRPRNEPNLLWSCAAGYRAHTFTLTRSLRACVRTGVPLWSYRELEQPMSGWGSLYGSYDVEVGKRRRHEEERCVFGKDADRF